MEIEVIHGQIIAKANHYQAVPGNSGESRLSKTKRYELMRSLSYNSVRHTRAGAFQAVFGYLSGYTIVQ